MRNNQRKKTTQHTATITGTITHAPRRIKTQTGRVMAAATVLVESDKRSPYPMQVIGFDLLALELMIYQRGEWLTVTGATGYHNGYQITAREVINNSHS
jgi:hypothetical protein